MYAVFEITGKVWILYICMYGTYVAKYSNRDNVTVQERLFNHMDDFLKLDVAIPQMADLLSEVC